MSCLPECLLFVSPERNGCPLLPLIGWPIQTEGLTARGWGFCAYSPSSVLEMTILITNSPTHTQTVKIGKCILSISAHSFKTGTIVLDYDHKLF